MDDRFSKMYVPCSSLSILRLIIVNVLLAIEIYDENGVL